MAAKGWDWLVLQVQDTRTSDAIKYTAWKVSKYGDFSSPYFPVFGMNTGKYGPDKTPYLDNFHAVK